MENAINDLWSNLHFEYNCNHEPMSFHFYKNSIKYLNENRLKSNYSSGIYPYSGRIYPYIPLFLLSIEELCPPNGIIMDPFAGSGTILLESLINPVFKRSAIGIEINPLGRLISKVKTTPLDLKIINNKKNLILTEYQKTDHILINVPKGAQFKFWHSQKGLNDLAKLRYSINNLENDDYKDFFWLIFSHLARKISRADPFIPPAVLLKPYKYENSPSKIKRIQEAVKNSENPDLPKMFTDLVTDNSIKINSLNKIPEIHQKEKTASIIWDDAREMRYGTYQYAGKICKKGSRKIRKNSIDLILTSPPYLTAQKYIRSSLLELIWLEEIIEEKKIDIESKSIGTESIHLTNFNFHEIGIPEIDDLIIRTLEFSKQRAAEVSQYFRDMNMVINEIHRVLKKDSYAILIVGNNKVRGETIETYKFLAKIGENCGFTIKLILKDPIRTRGMITKRHGNGGLIKDEYVLFMKKGV